VADPVTVMVNGLGDGTALQLTVRVEVPEAPGILVTLNVAVQPAGAPVAARVTVPVNPPTDPTVMAEVADCPALNIIDVGLAVTVIPD